MWNNAKTKLDIPRISNLILIFNLIVFISFGVVDKSLADGKERFSPLPWGIDSPAGGCVVCHSLERGGPFRVAPNLWGIVGAQKARDQNWYAYSTALLKKGGVWTEKELDAFLTDANKFLPGTKKSIYVRDPAERQNIITFLKGLND